MNAKPGTYRKTVVKAKRTAILKAAHAQFMKNGYTHAGMTEIACDADVSTATLYKHFRSKEILFTEIVEEAANNFRFEFSPPEQSGSLIESFCLAAKTGLKSYLESDAQKLLRIVIAEVPVAPDLAQMICHRLAEHWYPKAIGAIDELITYKLLKPHNAAISARFLIGMIKEVFVWEGLFRTDFVAPDDPGDRKLREIAELFLNHYGTDAPNTANVYWLHR
jgi:AcrR family transcriptional regulator